MTDNTNNNQTPFGDVDKNKLDEYQQEAKEKWGNTEAWKQSQERFGKMSKEDMNRIQQESDGVLKEITSNMDKGATSPTIQSLIAKHYNALRNWYEPNLEMYKGLADMYVTDDRFAAFFRKYHPKLPEFMKEAMHHFADTQPK